MTLKIQYLVRSAITLCHAAKAAADRRDRGMLVMAYEEQAKILETLHKMVKELKMVRTNGDKPKHSI